jgi:hypothetical protein
VEQLEAESKFAGWFAAHRLSDPIPSAFYKTLSSLGFAGASHNDYQAWQ